MCFTSAGPKPMGVRLPPQPVSAAKIGFRILQNTASTPANERTFAKLEKREPMAKIHHAAAQGFAAGAASYVAGRPGYPAENETWLKKGLGADSNKTLPL